RSYYFLVTLARPPLATLFPYTTLFRSADLDTGIHAALEHLGASLLVDLRGGGFLQHLLVTALQRAVAVIEVDGVALAVGQHLDLDRKSTRLNSSHVKISYAVFCLKKKK